MRFPTEIKLIWESFEGSTGISAFIAEIWVLGVVQQVCGCFWVQFVLLQEKKEEGFTHKDAQAPYDQTL